MGEEKNDLKEEKSNLEEQKSATFKNLVSLCRPFSVDITRLSQKQIDTALSWTKSESIKPAFVAPIEIVSTVLPEVEMSVCKTSCRSKPTKSKNDKVESKKPKMLRNNSLVREIPEAEPIVDVPPIVNVEPSTDSQLPIVDIAPVRAKKLKKRKSEFIEQVEVQQPARSEHQYQPNFMTHPGFRADGIMLAKKWKEIVELEKQWYDDYNLMSDFPALLYLSWSTIDKINPVCPFLNSEKTQNRVKPLATVQQSVQKSMCVQPGVRKMVCVQDKKPVLKISSNPSSGPKQLINQRIIMVKPNQTCASDKNVPLNSQRCQQLCRPPSQLETGSSSDETTQESSFSEEDSLQSLNSSEVKTALNSKFQKSVSCSSFSNVAKFHAAQDANGIKTEDDSLSLTNIDSSMASKIADTCLITTNSDKHSTTCQPVANKNLESKNKATKRTSNFCDSESMEDNELETTDCAKKSRTSSVDSCCNQGSDGAPVHQDRSVPTRITLNVNRSCASNIKQTVQTFTVSKQSNMLQSVASKCVSLPVSRLNQDGGKVVKIDKLSPMSTVVFIKKQTPAGGSPVAAGKKTNSETDSKTKQPMAIKITFGVADSKTSKSVSTGTVTVSKIKPNFSLVTRKIEKVTASPAVLSKDQQHVKLQVRKVAQPCTKTIVYVQPSGKTVSVSQVLSQTVNKLHKPETDSLSLAADGTPPNIPHPASIETPPYSDHSQDVVDCNTEMSSWLAASMGLYNCECGAAFSDSWSCRQHKAKCPVVSGDFQRTTSE